MKRILIGIILLIVDSSATIFAQYDQRAEAILAAVSDKHEKMTAFKADFVYSLKSVPEKIDENIKGSITIKGEKFRLKMDDGQEVFNNKSTVWTYIKGEKNQKDEVTITNYETDSDDINLAKIYNLYKKGFKYNFMEEQKMDGEMCDIIDLTPEDKEKDYYKIRLTINKRTKDLKSCQIFEKTGKRTSIIVTNLVPNIKVEDTYFAFDKAQHPNVRVVDLR